MSFFFPGIFSFSFKLLTNWYSISSIRKCKKYISIFLCPARAISHPWTQLVMNLDLNHTFSACLTSFLLDWDHCSDHCSSFVKWSPTNFVFFLLLQFLRGEGNSWDINVHKDSYTTFTLLPVERDRALSLSRNSWGFVWWGSLIKEGVKSRGYILDTELLDYNSNGILPSHEYYVFNDLIGYWLR